MIADTGEFAAKAAPEAYVELAARPAVASPQEYTAPELKAIQYPLPSGVVAMPTTLPDPPDPVQVGPEVCFATWTGTIVDIGPAASWADAD